MCAADNFCATHYRRPSDAFASILARLDTEPAVVVVDGPSGASVTVQVDQALVRAAVAEAISGTSTVGTLPSRLDRMASGDLAWPAERLVSRGWCLGSGLVCSPAIDASDGADFAFFCGGGIAGTPWDMICPAWLGDDRPSPVGSPSNRDIPTVALVGRTSPWAKPDEVEAALSGLARHTILATPWVPESFEFRCSDPPGRTGMRRQARWPYRAAPMSRCQCLSTLRDGLVAAACPVRRRAVGDAGDVGPRPDREDRRRQSPREDRRHLEGRDRRWC